MEKKYILYVFFNGFFVATNRSFTQLSEAKRVCDLIPNPARIIEFTIDNPVRTIYSNKLGRDTRDAVSLLDTVD